MINNIRDLGGIRTKDGKTIKQGCLIRSANLSQAEEQDVSGISTIIDLRTPGEREEKPDCPCGREYLPIPIFEHITAGISHEKNAEKKRLPDMSDLYRWLVRECRDNFKKAVSGIMAHDYSTGAVLWHCSEGKDRCGLTTALILEILGVDRKVIMEDYLKTNAVNIPKAEAIREKVKETHGEEFAQGVYRAYIADEAYLEAGWSEMGDDYIEQLGITDKKIEEFRGKMLE
ncbi:MAG: tyrosine-protein phosphatase [Lachnospiraceae bacterium]|nr:tyrosine-protein phosphatase [Lachnospiraceae bacterium]